MASKKWIWISIAAVGGFISLFIISLLAALLIFDGDRNFTATSGVGLIEVKGMIIDAQDTVRQLHEFRKDGRIKAIVIRVDSPGGVVGPSQEIYSEVKKTAAVKKVIVSMGSVAASGGYYISAPASLIMANPGTMTGSIGVLMKLTNMEGLMGKVGMKAFTLKTGKFKDSGSPIRPFTDQDRAVLQGLIDNTHAQFVKAVAEGRKLPLDKVAAIADGRVLTGEQALEAKLVDRIGTLKDAIEEAGRLGGIKGEPALIKPPKKKKFPVDLLVESVADRVVSAMKSQAGGVSLNYEMEGFGR